MRRQRAEPEGNGAPAKEEKELALKVLRGTYSPERRKLLAAAWQREAERIQREKDEERRKLAEARAELEGKPKPGPKPKEQEDEPDPDLLWLKANALQHEKKDYAAAIAVYEKLIAIAPDSDYAPEARKRIAALKDEPEVKQAVADEDAAGECRKWLSLAANYARAGLNDKAILYYQKIVDKHPDSSFAAEARAALKKLQGKP